MTLELGTQQNSANAGIEIALLPLDTRGQAEAGCAF